MQINNIKLSAIKPYEKNAKFHSPKQVKQIADSIKAFGFNQPLVLDKENIIIVGHGRYFAAKLLELQSVPALIANDLSAEKVAAYRLADNKLNESEWNLSLVIEELKLLESGGLDIAITGFSKDIFGLEEDGFDAEAEKAKITTPRVKFGELWALGEHRLLCGDSTKVTDFERLMGGVKARLVFTDPPYGVAYQSSAASGSAKGKHDAIKNDDLKSAALTLFLRDCFTNLFMYSAEDACFYIWHATSTADEFKAALLASGLEVHQTIIWLKSRFTLSRSDYQHVYEPCFYGWKKDRKHFTIKKLRSYDNVIKLDVENFAELLDVWYINRDKLSSYEHPTQKPIRLAERAIKKSSETGDIVVDCFGGSGSTLMACEQMNRKCRIMELDPLYCTLILNRWERFTNKMAKKINA